MHILHTAIYWLEIFIFMWKDYFFILINENINFLWWCNKETSWQSLCLKALRHCNLSVNVWRNYWTKKLTIFSYSLRLKIKLLYINFSMFLYTCLSQTRITEVHRKKYDHVTKCTVTTKFSNINSKLHTILYDKTLAIYHILFW